MSRQTGQSEKWVARGNQSPLLALPPAFLELAARHKVNAAFLAKTVLESIARQAVSGITFHTAYPLAASEVLEGRSADTGQK